LKMNLKERDGMNLEKLYSGKPSNCKILQDKDTVHVGEN
jgi:hypothetical protein